MAPYIYLSPPHMGKEERALLLAAFDSNWIAPVGPDLTAFENEMAAFLQARYTVALASGTAALHLALRGLGVESGDTVLVPSFTFAATANAVTYVGATPVFLDSDRHTWTLDPELVAEELDRRARQGALPKAVVAVDLYGQCADYDRLRAACARYDLPLLEDAAEALGSSYRGRPAGTLADVGVLSFNGNKIITTSGGGMLVTDDRRLAEQARHLSTQAREPLPYYEHRVVGYNYRLSNLLAAIGRGQLRVLDERVKSRRYNREFYWRSLSELPGLEFLPLADYGESNCWLTCLLVDAATFGATAEEIRRHLEEQGIESRPTWKPMHLQPAFSGCEMRGGAVAEDLFARGLCLPSGSSLTDSDRERVVAAIRATPRHRG